MCGEIALLGWIQTSCTAEQPEVVLGIPACVWKEMSYLQGSYEPLGTPAGPAARSRSASAENRWVRALLALAFTLQPLTSVLPGSALALRFLSWS